MSNFTNVRFEDFEVEMQPVWVARLISISFAVGCIAVTLLYFIFVREPAGIIMGCLLSLFTVFILTVISIPMFIHYTPEKREQFAETQKKIRYLQEVVAGMPIEELRITIPKLRGFEIIRRKLELTRKEERRKIEEELDGAIERKEKDPIIREILRLQADDLSKVLNRAIYEKYSRKGQGKFSWQRGENIKISHSMKLTDEKILYVFKDLKKEKRNRRDKREFYYQFMIGEKN